MTSTDAELIDQLCVRRTQINALEAAEVASMLDYVDRARAAGEERSGQLGGRLEADGALHELSLARKLPVRTIQDMVCRARRTRSGLPSAWAASLTGELSTTQMIKIDNAALRLTRAESLIELDRVIVDVASGRTPARLASWLDRFVERIEPDQVKARHEMAMQDRRVHVQPVGDGMAILTAYLPILTAAAIESRLDAEARSLPASDPRTHDQARADFCANLLLGRSDAEGATKTVIGVTVPLASLMGFSDAPGELDDRTSSVPAWIVREAARQQDTLIYRLLTDERGHLLDATWLGRYAPAKLEQLLEFRDATSVFPTSTVPAKRCDKDHSESWPAPTTAANMAPLNRRTQILKTAGILSMRQPEPGVFTWTTRTGHTYTKRSEPLPTSGWDDSARDQPDWFRPDFNQLSGREPPDVAVA